jgi:hypothetical protein
LGLVIGEVAAGQNGPVVDGGVQHGRIDGDLGCVVDSERNRQGEGEADHLVGDVLLEVEECGTGDDGSREDRSGAVASGDISDGRVDDAHEGAGYFDGSVLRAKELRVVAAIPEEELVLESGVGVCEGTALWLEDGADALVRGDDIVPCKELLFTRAMTRFMVERVFWKLASSITASSSLDLWRVMSTVGVATRVAAEVIPEACKTV